MTKPTSSSKASEILKRLKQTSSIKESSNFLDSEIYTLQKAVPTTIPIINLALSGKFYDGGITRGLTIIAGESRTFKTNIGIICLKAYMDYYPESIGLLYDSEFSFTPSYLNSFGVDLTRIFISPIVDIDKLKNDIINQVDSFTEDDKVFILVDSIGNLASLKETEDAIAGKSSLDMTRAKMLKSLFRMITPRVNLKNIPLFAINHIYHTQELYSKPIISGGQGPLLSANTAIITSRRKMADKVAGVSIGMDFVMKIEKSRFMREGVRLPLSIPTGSEIKRYSGLWDLALETGFLEKEGNSFIVPEIPDFPKASKKKLEDNDSFWKMMFEKTTFVKTIEENLIVSVDQTGLFKNDIQEEFTEFTEFVPTSDGVVESDELEETMVRFGEEED